MYAWGDMGGVLRFAMSLVYYRLFFFFYKTIYLFFALFAFLIFIIIYALFYSFLLARILLDDITIS